MGECDEQALTVLGGEAQSGAYVLRMQVGEWLPVRFGRFRGGEEVHLEAGAYLYVGSAMDKKGASSLAWRLVRHATRRDGEAHAIRAEMLAAFAPWHAGTRDLRPRGVKRLFWHVDHLLEPEAVQLSHVLVLRREARLEE